MKKRCIWRNDWQSVSTWFDDIVQNVIQSMPTPLMISCKMFSKFDASHIKENIYKRNKRHMSKEQTPDKIQNKIIFHQFKKLFSTRARYSSSLAFLLQVPTECSIFNVHRPQFSPRGKWPHIAQTETLQKCTTARWLSNNEGKQCFYLVLL